MCRHCPQNLVNQWCFVFWTNRLNFIAQTDAIANGPWKKLLIKFLGLRDPEKVLERTGLTNSFGKAYWKRLMDMFEDDVEEGVFSLEYWCATLMRFVAFFFIIPAWIVLGLGTCGWLWPPQISEYVFLGRGFTRRRLDDQNSIFHPRNTGTLAYLLFLGRTRELQ